MLPLHCSVWLSGGLLTVSCLETVSPKASVLSPCSGDGFQDYHHNQIPWFLFPCVFSGYKCWDHYLGCPSCLAFYRSWWRQRTVMALLEFGSAPLSLPVSLVVVTPQEMQHPDHALPSFLHVPVRPFLQRTPDGQAIQCMERILPQAENRIGCWSCMCGLRAEFERCVREGKWRLA